MYLKDYFNSFETLMKLPGESEGIRKIITLALSNQDPLSGRILNHIPEYNSQEGSYNASDATLLCFMLANRYVQKTNDVGFTLQVLQSAENVISHFTRQEVKLGEAAIDGAPHLDGASGLLLSVPQHSWIDTSSQTVNCNGVLAEGLPNRPSKTFLSELWNHVGLDQNLGVWLASPYFFLPEINAEWIIMLRGIASTAKFWLGQSPEAQEASRFRSLHDTVSSISRRAEQSFKSIFWNTTNGYLYNIVFGDQLVKDCIETEPGLVAVAMLGKDIFSTEELYAVWNCVRRKLLLNRKLLLFGNDWAPFGVMAKNEEPSVFYDDDQYHGDVVWLRSTPYLIHLLRMLGHITEIKSLLLNTLDHQMSEGAVFYNHELFGRPIGNNPFAEMETQYNPVPVKNPIQYWSQWCDVFVEFFEGKD